MTHSKELSQHTFMNAFYTVMFGAHNTTGIHGACAIDILHTIYLGLFLRVRDCFSPKLGRRLLVRMSLMPLLEYGELFARQSDRNMPKSKFNVGITGGKLMAKEYEGVLLLLATIVRSSAGRKILQDTNLGNFNDDQIADWLLLETLLGWVQWLKSEKMQVKHVDASSGNIDISCSWSKVIRRTEGGDEVQQIPFNFAHHK
jgi:hypothetical protein